QPAASAQMPPPSAPTQPASFVPGKRLAELLNGFRSFGVIGQLQDAKLIRAVESKRQLQEVLVDFWGNHFNIDVKKNVDRVLKVADDRNVIRAHIFGKFRDLLEASAKSPAMLVYLDKLFSPAPPPVGPGEQILAQVVHEKMGANGNGSFAPEVPAVGQKRGG